MRRYEKSRLSPEELLTQAGADKLEKLTKIIRAVGRESGEYLSRNPPKDNYTYKKVYSKNWMSIISALR